MARGEYRSIHTVIADSPEFIDLQPEAQLIWFHLKLKLGPAGIDVLFAPEAGFSEITGLSVDAIGDAIGDLIANGWLRRERNVLWLRNGLRFEPKLSLGNENHRSSIIKHLHGLPKLGIVNDFARYYDLPEPFPEHGMGDGMGDGIPDQGKGIRDVGNTKETTSSHERDESEDGGWPTPDQAVRDGYPEEFERTWQAYPNRSPRDEKKPAYHQWRRLVRKGEDPDNLQHAAETYAADMQAAGNVGTGYVKMCATFFGPKDPWRSYLNGRAPPPGPTENRKGSESTYLDRFCDPA